MIEIFPPSLERLDDQTRLRAKIKIDGHPDEIWFSMPPEYGMHLTTDRLDAFVVGLLMLAMKEGRDIHACGPVSARLLTGLKAYQREAIAAVPKLKQVGISAEDATDTPVRPCQRAVGTGFSAGLDSFWTVYQYFVKQPPEGHRITHLLTNNCGAFGYKNTDRARQNFRNVQPKLSRIAKELDLPIIFMDTNLSDILRMPFALSEAPRNMACVLALQNLFGRYLYSSSYTAHDLKNSKWTTNLSLTENSALPHLQTGTLEVTLAGGALSRLAKTRDVIDWDHCQRELLVCIDDHDPSRNCGMCKKCLRQMYTLDLFGRLDAFSRAFDLARWDKRSRYFIADQLINAATNPLNRQVLDYLAAKDISFGKHEQILAAVLRLMPGFVKNFIEQRLFVRYPPYG